MKPQAFLDTCAVIDLIRGRHSAADAVRKFEIVAVPFIVAGELLAGARRSDNPQRELQKVANLLNRVMISGADPFTAINYGIIRSDLDSRGTPIPDNDIWIAAGALRDGLPIITRDKHFSHVVGIKLIEYSV